MTVILKGEKFIEDWNKIKYYVGGEKKIFIWDKRIYGYKNQRILPFHLGIGMRNHGRSFIQPFVITYNCLLAVTSLQVSALKVKTDCHA